MADPLSSLVAEFEFSDEVNLIFGQFIFSLSIFIPAIIICWALRGRLMPNSWLKCDFVTLFVLALTEIGISYVLGSHHAFVGSRITCFLITIAMSLLTLKNGVEIIVSILRYFVFGITAAFFSVIFIVLWPFFPRGAHFFYICRKIWSPIALLISGCAIDIKGRENIDFSKSAIIVSTHSSILDIMALLNTVPAQIPMLSKKSIFYLPILGQLAYLCGFIFIDRKKGEQAMEKLHKGVEKVIKRHQWLAIFSEGTRTPEGFIKPLKRGAFVMAIKSGLPIVPVAIVGTGKILPSKSFIIKPGKITVHFGKPIPTDGLSMENCHELQEKTLDQLLDLSGWQRYQQ